MSRRIIKIFRNYTEFSEVDNRERFFQIVNSIMGCSKKGDVTNLIDRQFVQDVVFIDLQSASFILQVQHVLV